jgi:ABC-type protease/lipase transport system fused ATPase/permease subunit
MFFRLFTVCSAHVSAFVIVLSESSCERNQKMGDLSSFEREQMVGAHLAGASVTKTAALLGASRARVSEVMSAYTNHGKRNSGRKSSLTESVRRTLRRIVS